MREAVGNVWETSDEVVCVLINRTLDGKNRLVMGGGQALEARDLYPTLPEYWGKQLLAKEELRPYHAPDGKVIYPFPTKEQVWNNSTLERIDQSIRELVRWYARYVELGGAVQAESKTRVAIPRPGCGLGGLDWKDVRPLLAPLDDNFTVWAFSEKKNGGRHV